MGGRIANTAIQASDVIYGYAPFNGYSITPEVITIIYPNALLTNANTFTLTNLITPNVNVIVNGTNEEVFKTPCTLVLNKPINSIITPIVGADPDIADTVWNINVVLDGTPITGQIYMFAGTSFILTEQVTATPPPSQYISYNYPNANFAYRDAYGFMITPSTVSSSPHSPPYPPGYIPATILATGPYPDAITMTAGTKVFYNKIQGIWQAGSSLVKFDENGYIQVPSGTSGTLMFYPATTRGHVSLTITVIQAPQTYFYTIFSEITTNTPNGFPIDITTDLGVSGVAAAVNYVATNPGGAVAVIGIFPNQIVTITVLKSKNITIGIDTFDITVLTPPAVQSINVQANTNYDVVSLVNISSAIDPNTNLTSLVAPYTYAVAGSGSPSVPPQSHSWMGVGTITVCGVLIANITAINITLTITPIYTRLNKPFNIWKYISPSNADAVLTSVISNGALIQSLPDGTITIPTSTSSITVNFIMLGVEFHPSITVYIISDNAIIEYMTQSYTYSITGNAIVLNGNAITPPANLTECTVIATSGNFLISNLTQTVSITSQSKEYILYPIQPIADISVLYQSHRTFINAIVDQGAMTFVEPVGPTYEIDSVDYYGGSMTIPNVSALSDYPDITVSLPNYNDGNSTIYIKAISGQKKVVYLVHSITIFAVLLDLTDIPSFITNGGGSFTATNQGITNDVVIAKYGGVYYQYSFVVLPPVSLVQDYYFTPGQTYIDVLPTYGYVYGSLNLNSAITVGSIPFTYGELSGTITFTQYTGTSISYDIYLIANVPGQSIKDSSGNSLTLPYDIAGLLISVSGSNIVFTRTDTDVNMGEYFVTNAGTVNLVSFHSLPAFTHPDVYIFQNSTWIIDVPASLPSPSANITLTIGGSNYAYGDTYTLPTNTDEITANVVYYNTAFSFNIIKESGILTTLNFVNSAAPSITGTIVGFSTDLPNLTTYNGSARITTSNCKCVFTGNAVLFTALPNLAPTTNFTTYQNGTSTIYIRVNNSGTLTTLGFTLNTYQIPYSGIVEMEYFSGTPLTFTSTITGVAITSSNTYAPGTPIGNLTTYTFWDMSGSFTLNVVVIPVPVGFDTYEVIQAGTPSRINILTDLFDTNENYTLLSAVSSNPSNMPITFLSTGRIIISPASNAPITTNTIAITINSTAISTTSPLVINMTIHVTIWSPSTVTQLYAWGNTGTPAIYPSPSLFPTLSKLLEVNHNGITLTGTNSNGLDWSTFPNITVTSLVDLVDQYFFYTSAGVFLLNVVILQAQPPPQTINVVALPATVNLIRLFYPDIYTSFLGTNILTPNNTTYTSYSVINATTYVVSLMYGTFTLATVTITAVLVAPPVVTGTLNFSIPIGKTTNILSASIAPNAILTTTPTANYSNYTNGIRATFATVPNPSNVSPPPGSSVVTVACL